LSHAAWTQFRAFLPPGTMCSLGTGSYHVPLKTTVVRLVACAMIGFGPMLVFADATSHIGNEILRLSGFGLTGLGVVSLLLNPRVPHVMPPAASPDATPESD
jgi:hypothetical protein